MPPTAFRHPDIGTLQVVLPKNVPKRLQDNYFEMRLQNFGKKKMKRTSRKGREARINNTMKHVAEHVCDMSSNSGQSSLSPHESFFTFNKQSIQEQQHDHEEDVIHSERIHVVNGFQKQFHMDQHVVDTNHNNCVNNNTWSQHTQQWDVLAAQQETASILFALELEIAKSFETKPAVQYGQVSGFWE